jgi:DNA-binding transcriptional regulator YiaG
MTRELQPQAKLTPIEVREIRAALAARPVSQHDLARRYHVSQTTISRIANRRTWRAVPDLPAPPPTKAH